MELIPLDLADPIAKLPWREAVTAAILLLLK
jgi:hypothetical protein